MSHITLRIIWCFLHSTPIPISVHRAWNLSAQVIVRVATVLYLSPFLSFNAEQGSCLGPLFLAQLVALFSTEETFITHYPMGKNPETCLSVGRYLGSILLCHGQSSCCMNTSPVSIYPHSVSLLGAFQPILMNFIC